MTLEHAETPLLKLLAMRIPFALRDVHIERRNNAHGKLEHGGYVRNGTKGKCDAFLIVGKTSKHIEVETKSASGKLRPEQRNWKAYCDAQGIAHVVLTAHAGETPDKTVERWIDELRRYV